MTTTTPAPLTAAVAFALGDLLNWITQKRKVHYTLDGGRTIRTGTLRHVVVGPDNFSFLGRDTDIRDAYVRITLTSGVEATLGVSQIIELMDLGGFGPVDPPR
jgi:hypothetical protein